MCFPLVPALGPGLGRPAQGQAPAGTQRLAKSWMPACAGMSGRQSRPMDFSFTPEQEAIRAAIQRICERFDADYWLTKDREGGFPHDFHKAFADAGWLGICIPEDYGGS